MVLLPVVDGLERRGLSRALTSIVLVILLPQRCDAKLLQVLFPQARKDRLVYVILAEDRLSVGIFLSSKDLSCLPGISGATCSLGNFPGCLTTQRLRREDQRALGSTGMVFPDPRASLAPSFPYGERSAEIDRRVDLNILEDVLCYLPRVVIARLASIDDRSRQLMIASIMVIVWVLTVPLTYWVGRVVPFASVRKAAMASRSFTRCARGSFQHQQAPLAHTRRYHLGALQNRRPQWVIHVIRAIPASPVLPKSGHSPNCAIDALRERDPMTTMH
jgi:hypothetical protein